ncbi:MAG: hypothetical protein IJZ08_02680 [Clostridia bacterium]|nr:hypothetical protein [Clostridia bacterium]
MKLNMFVKAEPERAGRVLIILSVAFLTCFAALIALGGVSVYVENNRRERAALLTAAEVLSVSEALEESDVQVSSAVAASHSGDFLSDADCRLLTELIAARDARFSAFCAEIRTMLDSDRFSAAAFVRALRAASDDVGILSEAARVQSPQEMASLIGVRRDYASLAAGFIGVRNIFSAEGACAYCQNAAVIFSGESGRPIAYAVSDLPGDPRLSEEACVNSALAYAAGKFDLRELKLFATEIRDGICRAVIGNDGCTAVAGVRMDSGAVVYFWIENM